MQIRTAHEMGLRIRERRRALGWTQAELAARIGATRQWVHALESGKPTVEFDLVLKVITAVGLVLDLRDPYRVVERAGTEPASPGSVQPGTGNDALTADGIDSILDRARTGPARPPLPRNRSSSASGQRSRAPKSHQARSGLGRDE